MVSRDIIAPRSVEIIDIPSTAEAQKRLLSAIPPVYRVDPQTLDKIEQELEEFLNLWKKLVLPTLFIYRF